MTHTSASVPPVPSSPVPSPVPRAAAAPAPAPAGYPHGRGYGHDYMRGGEVFAGYGYSAREEYARRRGESDAAYRAAPTGDGPPADSPGPNGRWDDGRAGGARGGEGRGGNAGTPERGDGPWAWSFLYGAMS